MNAANFAVPVLRRKVPDQPGWNSTEVKSGATSSHLTLDEKKVIYQRSEERFVMYLLLMVRLQLGVGIYRSLASEVIPLGIGWRL
jgi:hypothetical protein